MSSNTPPSRDIKTQGIVLRHTNYGEADRILAIITPEGKMSVMARGVRKPKSRLAGGVEMFTVSEMMVHVGRAELGALTGARMVEHYEGIMKDYNKMMLAGAVLKQVSKASEQVKSEKWFEVTRQTLKGLNGDEVDSKMIEAWAWLNLVRAGGEEINLYRDVQGEKLNADTRYEWDVSEEAFAVRENGGYGADEIKLLRLMVATGLDTIKRVKLKSEMLDKMLKFSQIVARR